MRLRGERGAGTVVTLGVGLGIVAVFLIVLPLCATLAARHTVAAAADAAALAAADTASGLVPGHPCEAAQRVASANGAAVVACSLDGWVATVATTRWVLGLSVTEIATAGPAGSAAD